MTKDNKNSYITDDTLKNMLKTVMEEYQKKFVDKYEFDIKDSYWTGNILSVADYFFDFYDVVYAVDNEVPEFGLFNWYDYNMTLGTFSLGKINLENYINGKRPYNEKDIEELNKLESEFNKTKSAINDLLFKIKNNFEYKK